MESIMNDKLHTLFCVEINTYPKFLKPRLLYHRRSWEILLDDFDNLCLFFTPKFLNPLIIEAYFLNMCDNLELVYKWDTKLYLEWLKYTKELVEKWIKLCENAELYEAANNFCIFYNLLAEKYSFYV